MISLEFFTTMSSGFRQSDSAILQHCDAHVLLANMPQADANGNYQFCPTQVFIFIDLKLCQNVPTSSGL